MLSGIRTCTSALFWKIFPLNQGNNDEHAHAVKGSRGCETLNSDVHRYPSYDGPCVGGARYFVALIDEGSGHSIAAHTKLKG